MKICRKCGAKYFGGEGFCSLDGEPLVDPDETGQDPGSEPSIEPRDPFEGQRIEKYDIVKRLGEGGMGEVYEARHVHIGKRVALKVLREDFSNKEEVVERFRQEARSATIIGHENIIDITDFGTTPDGRFFFVMEYLDGEDLAAVFEKQATVPYERALRILKQVCRGLVAAHEKGIIHRDLKPENIYLVNAGQPDEQVKILDFGIAKMSMLDGEGRKLTKTGMVFGTPEYMSPEQAEGKPVDHRIDVYAVGVIMYEMFTGVVPFTGDTFMSILSKHMFEPVPSMRTKNPRLSLPASMEQLVMKALAKDPDERFGSMSEMLAALQAVEENPEQVAFAPAQGSPREPLMTTPGPVLEVVGDADEERPRSRKGLTIALVAVAVLAVLAVGAAVGLPRFLAVEPEGEPADDPDPTQAAAGPEPEPLAGVGEAEEAETTAETPTEQDEAAGVALVTLEILTDPEGARVEIEGLGQVCDSTPCEVMVDKDEELSLLASKGKLASEQTVVASGDPTVAELRLEPRRKPKRRPGKHKKDDEEEPSGDAPQKGGSVDMGELKIPNVYKKKDE